VHSGDGRLREVDCVGQFDELKGWAVRLRLQVGVERLDVGVKLVADLGHLHADPHLHRWPGVVHGDGPV
jgi:hypothetical protein